MISSLPSFLLLTGGFFAIGISFSLAVENFPPEQIEFFEKSVRPVLADNCHDCHGAHKHENGLRLDLRSAILRGSDYGKVVEAGNPASSKLIKAINHSPGVEAMPKKGAKLSPGDIAALEKWVLMGMPWPVEKEVVHEEKSDPKAHWAFQPLEFGVRSSESARETVDRLVVAKLKAVGLDFAPAADPATLCRRIHYTLTGLQPSYEAVQAFIRECEASPSQTRTPHSALQTQAATAALVAKLLATPAYGERWGRHWLDVARYADTDGYQVAGRNINYPYAYTYRDWVVQALNQDMPYDQFLMYQLAADKMTAATPESPHLAALGFLNVGDKFISDRHLQIDDRIDVVARGMIGLTVACARCHDHKYDPIPSRDYYAMYSIFNSSEEPDQKELPIIGKSADEAAFKEYQTKIAEVAKKEFDFKREVYEEVRKPEAIANYLVFAQEAQDIKDRNTFRGRAGQLKLRDKLADDWRDLLKKHALGTKPHPVMLAWKEFAALPAGEFAAKAPEVVQRLTQPTSGLSGVPRHELAKRPAPKSLNDVAAMYADIFLTCLDGKEPDNDDWKKVREVVSTTPSPMAVPVERANEFFTRKDLERLTKMSNERVALDASHPGAPPRAMVSLDKPKPADVRVFMRGNPGRQGDPAPRAWLTLFGGEKFTDGSGRLELAKKIASRDNPLTARVIVNRVWTQHFGRPLVGQTSDFGVQTPKPVQADVLDYLATYFMENGWSLKKLHTLILTTRTYAQSTQSTPEKDLKDAENDLLSRQTRQRLDYESMRDAMLQAAGELDFTQIGGRAIQPKDKEAETRRTIYQIVNRYDQPTVPAMFDFANPDSHSPIRYVTTVPQQALFLMNSPFMKIRATNTAAKVPLTGSAADSQAIQALYHRVLHREPSARELELAQHFCSDADTLSRESAAFVWRYGHSQIEKDSATGRVALARFTPFEHFGLVGKSTHRWTPAKEYPSKEFGHLYIGAGNGHPGHSWPVVMQWRSPFGKERLRISGTIKRGSDLGNGVRAWIISSLQGKLREELVKPTTTVEMSTEIEISAGETLSFVVEAENKDTNSDAFTWAPRIERLDSKNGQPTLLTKADTDFCGPTAWPLNRAKSQKPMEQLAQVLLMSNEFQFVD